MSGFLGSILSGGLSELFGPIVQSLADLIPDPQKKAAMLQEMQEKLLAADQAMEASQSQIDNTEAASTNVFIAGWRPAVGWVCVAALSWQVVLQPVLVFALTAFGYKTALPVIDGTYITLLLIPMLGLGVSRTVEKIQGVADSNPLTPMTATKRKALSQP